MKFEESILNYLEFPLRLKGANIFIAHQLSFIFILSVVIIAQRDPANKTDIGSPAIKCPANDGSVGNCLRVAQCRRKMIRMRQFQTPSMCFVQQGVRYLCCPVTKLRGTKQPNTTLLDALRPENPRPNPDIQYDPSTIPRLESELMQPSHGFNLSGCGKKFISSRRSRRVVAGGIEARKHAWPWMAGIRVKANDGKSTNFVCGGSLITNRHVLTAAHCFGSYGRYRAPSDYQVVLGGHYNDGGTASIPDEEGVIVATPTAIKILENYESDEGHDNDIAVLVLDRNISFNDYVNSVCLPTVANYQEETDLLVVIGWGHTSFNGSSSKTLQEAVTKVVNTGRCRYLYRRVPGGITDNMLCAGNVENEGDSCQFDSGGPLMRLNTEEFKWVQVGIVSFGGECRRKDYPGVYVKVSSYLPWIQQIICHT